VETAEQQHMLRTLGCDLAQGWNLSRPLAAAQIPDWWQRWRQAAN
jgi:EAL domain-containing protein (putative c-di-GMP-specific phosphodiesterase class I)